MSTKRLVGLLSIAVIALAQTPAFEVASVKMSEPITPELVQSGRLQMGVTIDSKYVRITKLSLLELVALAFQVKGHQMSTPPVDGDAVLRHPGEAAGRRVARAGPGDATNAAGGS